MADATPQQRYRVIEKLASGGMAEVYRAESAGLEGFKKQVAIKRVLPHLSEKKKFISMFLDEARLSAHLSHSNCVQVFDIGVGDSAYFIVMEYVDGADLKAVIESLRKQGREFPMEEAVWIATRIAEGLSYAHELVDEHGKAFQIVHRDVSPPNVLITKYGEVKIVDFGLAKASSQLEKSEPGIIKGKFSYLSPEAASGHEVDARTDIFAVGIILWEMLAGRRLFLGDNDYATVKQVQTAQVPPITRGSGKIPAQLQVILNKALARDPEHRFQTARDLAASLNEFLYRNSNPVSSYSIAELVRVAQREKRNSRASLPGSTIIDKLIEEALFEFTSLEGGDASEAQIGRGAKSASGAGSNAGLLGAGDAETDWATELAKGAPKPVLGGVFEEGNLAALEDLDERSSRRVGRPSAVGAPQHSLVPSRRLDLDDVRDEPTGSALGPGMIALIALSILVMAGCAYWFGLIPGFAPAH